MINVSRSKILVAIDFEEQSMNALEHSYEMARLFDADLVLIYVIEGISVVGKLRSPEDYVKSVIAEAHEKFDELEKLASKASSRASVRVTALIERGKPYERIIQAAIDQEAILIIIGKNNDSSLRKSKNVAGSNSMNVVREAPCPVITINLPPQHPGRFTKILLPLDFTRQTKKQVQKAIEFGGYFGAQIHILSILSEDNKVTKLLKQVQLNQVKNAIQKNGIQCHTEFLYSKEGRIADIIVDYSKKIEADLIVIMTQQKKSFINFYVGSTAHEIISHSEIPVISIIPIAEFRPGMVTSMVDPFGLIKNRGTQGESAKP